MRIHLDFDLILVSSNSIIFIAFLHHWKLLQMFMIFELSHFEGLFFHFDFPSSLFELLINFASCTFKDFRFV